MRQQKKRRDALAKIQKAREINNVRQERQTAEAELRTLAESSLKEEATALYQAAVDALLTDDLTTAKSNCEASLKAFETPAAQKLLTTINHKIKEKELVDALKNAYQELFQNAAKNQNVKPKFGNEAEESESR